MIITESKPFQEILDYLENGTTLFLVGCGSCAAQCETGGEDQVRAMADRLREHGKQITGQIIPDETCHIPLVKKQLNENREALKQTDAVLVLACGAGTQAVSSLVNKPVYPACNTLFLGDVKRLGDFTEYCSLCGECILGQTGGICPVTRCPKGILNGPCGGMHDGRCETDEDQECVWVQIWERLRELGCLHHMKKRRPPKNHAKKRKPGAYRVERLRKRK